MRLVFIAETALHACKKAPKELPGHLFPSSLTHIYALRIRAALFQFGDAQLHSAMICSGSRIDNLVFLQAFIQINLNVLFYSKWTDASATVALLCSGMMIRSSYPFNLRYAFALSNDIFSAPVDPRSYIPNNSAVIFILSAIFTPKGHLSSQLWHPTQDDAVAWSAS